MTPIAYISRRLALLALTLGAAAPSGCHHQVAPESRSDAPDGEAWLEPKQVTDARLVVEPLGEHEIGGPILAAGKVSFDDQHVSHVYSPVTGRVVSILAQLGERVKKGQPLARIESPDIGLASADLDKAQADLVAAEHDVRRQKELYEAHAGSERDFEAAQDNFAKARAELERARQKAHLLRTGAVDRVTQTYELRALIDGEVVAKAVNPGMEVQGQYSGGGAVELFTIGELDPVWVLADVYEMDLGRVRAGENVQVKVVAFPDRTFLGKVDWVSGTLDPATRTAKVRCTIPNGDHLLKPEMFATAAIDVDRGKALALPRDAVFRIGEQTMVFVRGQPAPGGRVRFERRPVAVDEDETGSFVRVLRGVSPGEPVVVSGGILLVGAT